MKKLLLYIIRWQLSTPILAIFTGGLCLETMLQAGKANLVGALIFYNIDKFIFKLKK